MLFDFTVCVFDDDLKNKDCYVNILDQEKKRINSKQKRDGHHHQNIKTNKNKTLSVFLSIILSTCIDDDNFFLVVHRNRDADSFLISFFL